VALLHASRPYKPQGLYGASILAVDVHVVCAVQRMAARKSSRSIYALEKAVKKRYGSGSCRRFFERQSRLTSTLHINDSGKVDCGAQRGGRARFHSLPIVAPREERKITAKRQLIIYCEGADGMFALPICSRLRMDREIFLICAALATP